MTATRDDPTRQLRADARRNRDRILTAAREVFARDGVDAQIDEVAVRAGVGVGTVYRHFPTKEALVVEMVRSKFRDMVATAREVSERDGGAFEVFAAMLREVAEVCAQDAVAIQAVSGNAQEVIGEAESEQAELLAIAAPVLERAQREGTVRRSVAIDDIPMLMCGVSATMGNTRPGFDWHRHLELLIELMRA